MALLHGNSILFFFFVPHLFWHSAFNSSVFAWKGRLGVIVSKCFFPVFLFFPLSGATIGPSVSWSRVQTSSLTPAQGPTSTWRSSMSVCPTVSMTLLSWIEDSPSSYPPIHSFSLFFSAPSVFLVSHHSYFFLPPCPDILLSSRTTHTFQHHFPLSLLPSVSLWTFHEIWPVKPFGPLLYCLYYWCARRVSSGSSSLVMR